MRSGSEQELQRLEQIALQKAEEAAKEQAASQPQPAAGAATTTAATTTPQSPPVALFALTALAALGIGVSLGAAIAVRAMRSARS